MNRNEMLTAVVAIVCVLLLAIVITIGVVEYQESRDRVQIERIKACAPGNVNDQVVCVRGLK